MAEIQEGNCWVALTVKPRHEQVVAQTLRNKGFEDFVPLYRARRLWSDRVKWLDLPLFAGYVFCRFEGGSWLPVLETRGVRSIVGFGGRPSFISNAEIAAVQAIVASGLPAEPWPYVRVGQKVRIECGCLSGLQGILIRDKDPWRVVVSVELLPRSVSVEIHRGIIRAVSGRESN